VFFAKRVAHGTSVPYTISPNDGALRFVGRLGANETPSTLPPTILAWGDCKSLSSVSATVLRGVRLDRHGAINNRGGAAAVVADAANQHATTSNRHLVRQFVNVGQACAAQPGATTAQVNAAAQAVLR
jgi:hypothetical protein